jgi:hypothetical protein
MRFSELEQNEELFDTFVELLADGVPRLRIAETMGVNKGTVTDWKRMPKVQDSLAKRIKERANEVMRHTDSKIVAKLQSAGDKISIDQLLKIRHEFAGDVVNLNVTGDGAKALQELLSAAHDDPALAAALHRVLPSSERV